MYAFVVLLAAAVALSQPSGDHFGMFIDYCVCAFERRRHPIVTADALFFLLSLYSTFQPKFTLAFHN